jgi:hypothetical protein
MRFPLFVCSLLCAAPFAMAQHSGAAHPSTVHVHRDAGGAHAPYAGMQMRPIKALSEPQTADLRAGKGMSLALPAELNGYALGLENDQRVHTERLFHEMQKEAKALGEDIIASEDELDRLFREKTATLAKVQDATARAAHLQGRLRATHLKYHLAMVDVLSPGQVRQYNQLRGYR